MSSMLNPQQLELDPSADERTYAYLRALPDELICVIGGHMAAGDQAVARLVCRRWRELMRQAVTRVSITPHQLSFDPQQQQQQQQLQQHREGLRVLRPRAPPSTHPSGRDKPPDCLMPPPDFALLPSTYPTLRDVSIRLLSRHGQRGEGVNTLPLRVHQLFSSLEAIARRHGARLREHYAAESLGLGHPGGLPPHACTATNTTPHGMHVSLEVDVDVPRTRHQQAHATALGLLKTTWDSLSRLGDGLSSLSLHWYEPSIAKLPPLAACLESFSGRHLACLKMGLTPGTLLPALAGLTALSSLQCTVGEDMHMADLQVPRHTEIGVLSNLKRLSCLKLGGWVCEVTLAHALQQLPLLSSLELGEDLGSLQEFCLLKVCILCACSIDSVYTCKL
ncbi:hypothetical protein DUNSADRAFT_8745 [Dunaliella salina]|uniref:F-box domain-containing protein n=1 Tax=Dunaliella salina TaxID=3046 RepID=A0ABQ7GIV8_DUNSA|nr:hypothetical protein DUNSADRAFT_8745 [Dunaliella salina]|eukprot:KAF5834537.1 hypothetical protein DUNSADRAFT_8745 [Dunaliella salina]